MTFPAGQPPNRLCFIDTETTGVYNTDRIVEIAAILTDTAGGELWRFETLLNPWRDVSASSIHGVTASLAKHAPPFRAVAGDLASILSDSIVVGHNVAFDLRYLDLEFSRAGVEVAVRALPSVCTRQMAGGGSLSACCVDLGLPRASAHRAMADCEAAQSVFWACGGTDAARFEASWMDVPFPVTRGDAYVPREAAHALQDRELIGYLEALGSLPPGSVSDITADGPRQYATLLAESLCDRIIDHGETERLVSAAFELGLDRRGVEMAHQAVLDQLVDDAAADGVLSLAEADDIEHVAGLLGLTVDVDQAFKVALQRHGEDGPAGSEVRVVVSLIGKSVCFTGELRSGPEGRPVTRIEATQMAEAAGCTVRKGVSRHVDYVVVADPESLSGKAVRARELGIPLVAEPTFWASLTIAHDAGDNVG